NALAQSKGKDMLQDTKQDFQVSTGMFFLEAGRLLIGIKLTRESVIRRCQIKLPLAFRMVICTVLAVLASCLSLAAQNVVLTGALSGRVTDQSGAVVPGASVVVQNLKTGVKQSAETNHTGLYRFPVLAPGFYSIAASLKGFRDVQGQVQVLVGNTTSQEIRLQVGAS